MKTMTKIISLLCLIAALLAFSGCGVTIHEGVGEGDALDKSSGTTWYHASTCYEAVELEKKLGKLVVTDKQSYEIYKLPNMDPDLWIGTEDKNVLYAEGVTLPTLADMKPTLLNFHADSSADKKLYSIDETDLLAAIVADYSENESVPYPSIAPHHTYRVRFVSDLYPGIYYALTYIEYNTDYVVNDQNYGKYFLYDRFDQKFIPVGDEIHTALGIE